MRSYSLSEEHHQTMRPCVLISGGSEIVSVSLAEELVSHDVPYIVVSLGRRSILRGLRGCIFHTVLDWPPVDPYQTGLELLDTLRRLGSDHGVPFPMFATEDGGLRLLLENQELLEPVAVFGRCRKLRMGGLDKCELFDYLENRGLSDQLVPWARARSAVEAAEAKVRLGGDVIAKPSLKPYSMELGLGGAKLISSSFDESPLEFESRIARSWNSASEWIVQKRLDEIAER